MRKRKSFAGVSVSKRQVINLKCKCGAQSKFYPGEELFAEEVTARQQKFACKSCRAVTVPSLSAPEKKKSSTTNTGKGLTAVRKATDKSPVLKAQLTPRVQQMAERMLKSKKWKAVGKAATLAYFNAEWKVYADEKKCSW